ncbi:RagB/SusD family nutrient uptake outer membrane protein [Arachidicoccus sp.]|uniref:RagB/SusD family nutrient uptake outer membrane protein n=1 Tax=Arachidicoccus sp. TaxID=1872624 RepID=UPI003D22E894
MKVYYKKEIRNQSLLLLILLLTVLSFSSGCKKFLEPAPKDVVLESNFPKSYWDAEFLLRGTYQALQPLVEYQFILGEMRGDWVTPGSGANDDILQLANEKVTGDNKYTEWQPYYDLINRANYLISIINKVPLDSTYFSTTTRAQYVGEARFLRCWGYFQLVENFGSVPFVWSAIDDISKVDTLYNIPPSSEDLILDSIEVDLNRAYSETDSRIYVPNSFDAGLRESYTTDQLRVRKQSVCALQAEVYLWRNKYNDALNACKNYNLIQGLPGGMNASWMNVFSNIPDVYAQEPLIRVEFSFSARETNSLMMLTSNDPASGGKYMVAPSMVAMKAYDPSYPNSISKSNLDNELYRGFGYSFAGSAPYYNRLNSDPVIWKFIGLGAVAPDTVNVSPTVRAPYQSDFSFYLYRCADVSLLWAEAANRTGDKATAISQINGVRGRVGMPNATVATTSEDSISVNSSTEKIEDYILRERGLELGFEGKRWFDLMRFSRHRGTPTSPDINYLVSHVIQRVSDDEKAGVTSILSDTKNWYLPYNNKEVQLNPSLKNN